MAEDAVAPWVEVYIDGTGEYAGIPSAANGDLTREYTVTQSAQVNLSSIDGVTITVNDVAVTPVVDNATYTLSMTVVQPTAEGEGETGDGTGEGDASGDQAAPAEGEAQDVPAEGEGSEQPVA